jgi:glyceraldehyde 3-phosphate dehydrogenase
MFNVAINGLGRIGRATLKIVMDTPELNLVAANDLAESERVVYLLKYDTVYGRHNETVAATRDGHLVIGTQRLTLLCEREPARLPWKSLNVDFVFECTGAFTRRDDLEAHIRSGARYVLLSAPSKGDGVETIVHGVNTPRGDSTIVSCASCTTNCITPVMEIHGRRIGVKKALMTTVHAYTAVKPSWTPRVSTPAEVVPELRTSFRPRPGRRSRPPKRCLIIAAGSTEWQFAFRCRPVRS